MGYLKELAGIRDRHNRCRAAWQPHLQRTKDVISRAIERSSSRRKAMILGSGHLYDIPLETLAQSFREVYLVDIIHPMRSRWGIRHFPNVHLIAHDLTGVIRKVYDDAVTPDSPPEPPRLFLDDNEVDLVASVNLLSQLPHLPVQFIRSWEVGMGITDAFEEKLNGFARRILTQHLEYLDQFRGTVALITDVEKVTRDSSGAITSQVDLLRGVTLPWIGESWVWDLAPRGEAHRVYAYQRVVMGMIRPERSAS